MKKFIVATAILLAASGAAFADATNNAATRSMVKHDKAQLMDTNGDGNVSPEEFKTFSTAKGAERFKKLDANSDGNISEAEFTANSAEATDKMFARMDRNGDGIFNKEDHKKKNQKAEPAEPAAEPAN